eukprot:GABV01000735.1.p2 GENE.GABV01000735.1~~GABV01000735.1.p2  ORF type:complete len:180 (+),score=44.52 GABV01000735.1:199-738(+)
MSRQPEPPTGHALNLMRKPAGDKRRSAFGMPLIAGGRAEFGHRHSMGVPSLEQKWKWLAPDTLEETLRDASWRSTRAAVEDDTKLLPAAFASGKQGPGDNFTWKYMRQMRVVSLSDAADAQGRTVLVFKRVDPDGFAKYCAENELDEMATAIKKKRKNHSSSSSLPPPHRRARLREMAV